MAPKQRLNSWLDRAGQIAARFGGANSVLPAAGFVGGVVLFLVLVLFQGAGGGPRVQRPSSDRPAVPTLAARPSDALRAAVVGEPVDFDGFAVETLRTNGYVSITLHVALYEDGRRGRKLGDGASPGANMYWGALFGIDNFLVNEAGWSRIFGDVGNGQSIVRRSIFHKRVEPTEAWIARGVEAPFDVYVLANAWPHSQIRDAMTAPIREAACGAKTTIEVEGRPIDFGAGSVMVGYLGQNEMLTDYWDPFAELTNCAPPLHQIGVFYIAPRSGILLHRPVIDHGLYSVLFAREIITPEAYIFDGMVSALISGEFGDAFLNASAASYARYQKSLSLSQARMVLVR